MAVAEAMVDQAAEEVMAVVEVGAVDMVTLARAGEELSPNIVNLAIQAMPRDSIATRRMLQRQARLQARSVVIMSTKTHPLHRLTR